MSVHERFVASVDEIDEIMSQLNGYTEDDFNPDQPRDDHGMWTKTGASSGSAKAEKFSGGLVSVGVLHSKSYDPVVGVHVVSTPEENKHLFQAVLQETSPGSSADHVGNKVYAYFSPDPMPTLAPKAELDMDELKKIGEQKGSNAGGVYQDKSTSINYYVKKPETKDHVKNELIAAALYKLAGVNTLSYVPVKGGEHVATRMETLDKNNVSQLDATQRAAAQHDFAVHAWLANWDAVGTGGDNVGVLNGRVTTLDTGGSLAYRAQGGPKGAAFGNEVTEINTLRDPSKNPDAAKLYGDMSNDDIKKSMWMVVKLSPKEIHDTIKTAGGSNELANKMMVRRNDIEAQLTKMNTAPPPAAATPAPEHPAAQYKKSVSGTSAERVAWRKQLQSLPNYSDGAKELKLKIIASFWKQHDVLSKNGSPKTADIASKLGQYAVKYKITNPLVAPPMQKTAPPASSPQPPKFFAEPKKVEEQPKPAAAPSIDLSSMSDEEVRQHMLTQVAGKEWVSEGASALNDHPKLQSYGLTASEIGFIKAFTGPYSGLNKQLRDGHMDEKVFYFKHFMNDALDKFPVYDGDKVWRKLKLSDELRAKYGKVGSVVHWSAFSSTAKNPYVWGGDTQFVIHHPKTGRDVQLISSHASEAEVIMPADTYYKVLKAPEYKTCEDGNKRYVIELEEVVPFGKQKKKVA